jgi:hypothetical protein
LVTLHTKSIPQRSDFVETVPRPSPHQRSTRGCHR